MKNLLKLSFLIIFFTSCEEYQMDQQVIVKAEKENAKIIFENTKDFYSTFEAVFRMSDEEQTEWVNSSMIKDPLCKNIEFCTDEVMLEMPKAFQALFDKNMETQIGDTVIVFSKGKLLVKSIKDKILSTPLLFGNVDTHQDTINAKTRFQYVIPFGGGTSFVTEITIPKAKHRYKYIHELKSIRIKTNNSGIFREGGYLYLVLRLVWKGSSGWNDTALEERKISIDLNICKQSLSGVKGKREILVSTQVTSPGTNHVLEITGTITHEIIGIPSTKRINGWNPPLLEWM